MDFFFRQKPWYAGQFVRKIIPKIELSKNSILYFTALLNKQKQNLLSVLVRDVDNTFKNAIVSLPVLANNQINFTFIEQLISELKEQRKTILKKYLYDKGLEDFNLTKEEELVLREYNQKEFQEFNIIDVFDVENAGNILSRDIVKNSGSTPYLCASSENNSVSSYISYDEKYLDKGNCVFIGGKTFVVTYQENDFYSNDSHNLVLYLKESEKKNKLTHLFLATCVNKSLGHLYSWGDSISNRKIQKDKVSLPIKNGNIDFEMMEKLISATQKMVMKNAVLYADGNANA